MSTASSWEARPLLDVASFARRGPGRRDRLSPEEIGQISRTVGRVPEVMVKVLSKGGQSLGAVQRHLDYISRGGEVTLETDMGEPVQYRGIGTELLEDWDLDLETDRRRSSLSARHDRRPPKLVHKLVFSMPAGTSPDKVLAAAQTFAREQFAMKHRYVMALHTDEPHPHVHMMVKAMSEQGERLNIRKATLREWRSEFARYLRAEGVAATATERSVRGESRKAKRDGIFRSARRGASTHMRQRVESVANELGNGALESDPGKTRLVQTCDQVRQGWRTVATILNREGRMDLALQANNFLDQMRPPRSERELIAEELLRNMRPPAEKERNDLTR